MLCDENAECSNEIGGFDCTCNTGYSGQGLMCSKFFITSTAQHALACLLIILEIECVCVILGDSAFVP